MKRSRRNANLIQILAIQILAIEEAFEEAFEEVGEACLLSSFPLNKMPAENAETHPLS